MRNPIERWIRITYNNIKSSLIQNKVYWKMAKEDRSGDAISPRGGREGLKFQQFLRILRHSVPGLLTSIRHVRLSIFACLFGKSRTFYEMLVSPKF